VSLTPADRAALPRSADPQDVAIIVPMQSGLRVSERVFARLCALNPDLRLERTSKKELIVMTPCGGGSSRCSFIIAGQLANWDREETQGVGFDSQAGFTLPNGAIVSPDAAWISKARWDALTTDQRRHFLHLSPDFVIEVVSPSDRVPVLREKMRQYIGQGVRLAWLIDPERELAEIHRAGREPEALIKPATLSGEDVLPGFVLNLNRIW
jgi:Uma2 family endonuclease